MEAHIGMLFFTQASMASLQNVLHEKRNVIKIIKYFEDIIYKNFYNLR